MMLLAFDTETSGFNVSHLPVTDPSQPNLVQLAALLIDTTTWVEEASINLIVKPPLTDKGLPMWTIPEQASRVHGISTDKAIRLGVPLRVATACFTNLRRVAQSTLAHNFEFDEAVMGTAIHRAGGDEAMRRFPDKNFCTARIGTETVKLPPTLRMHNAGRGAQFKTPNLQELHTHYMGRTFEGAHDALADIRACVACFRVMIERKEVVL